MTQAKNGNGPNPLEKLRLDVTLPRGSMPKGEGGYKRVFKAYKAKYERELHEERQDHREELRNVMKFATANAERDARMAEGAARMIELLNKQIGQLKQELKRISGNGNGIPTAIGHNPEAAAGEKPEEQHEEDDDTHGA